MTWPGWDSLGSVTRIDSMIRVATLVFWGLLVLCEVVAHIWESVKKPFNVLALIAFAVAVSGEFLQFKYDDRKEYLHDAREKSISDTFSQKLQAANDEAHNAHTEAQQSADNASQAQQRASTAEQEAVKLKEQQGFRVLTEQQKTQLIALLKPYAPQQLYFFCAPDSETTEFADEISSALNVAGWKTVGPPYNWGTITHYTSGVQIQVADITKPVPQGASVLQAALIKVGVQTDPANFPMVGQNGFALYVGLRPRPKQP